MVLWSVLLATVFVVAPSLSNPTVTGKYFYFSLAVLAASLVAAFRLFGGQAAFRICATDLLVLCFAAWAGVSFIVNHAHPGMKLWMFVLLVPLYLVIRTTLHDRNMIQPLVWVIVAVVTVEALWGFLQLRGFLKSYHSLFALSGSFFNPGPYAGFLACGVPLALYCVINSRSRPVKILGFICLITVGMILPATMSRAAWIAAVAGIIPVILHSSIFNIQSKIINQKSKILFPLFIGFFVAVALYGLYSFKKQSADGRILIWRVSADLVITKPLTGSGLGSFQALYDGAQADFILSGKATRKQRAIVDSPEYAFNEYVQITVEHGIIGLLLFMSVLFSFFVRRDKYAGADSVVFAVHGSLVAFCVFAMFSYPFSVLALTILFVVLAAMSASLSQPVERLHAQWVSVAAGVLCVAMAGYASAEILPRYTAYREWKSAQVLYNIGEFENAVNNYQHLYPKLNRQKEFLFEYARCLSATSQYDASNTILSRFLLFGSDPVIYNCMGDNFKNLGDYEKAEKMYFRASQIVPSRHLPLYLLMKLYQETGQIEKANVMAKTLLEKPVKVHSATIREIQEEARKLLDKPIDE